MRPDPGDDSSLLNPQSFNKYAYVRNNPVNAFDPDGKNVVWASGLSDKDKERLTKALAKAYRNPDFKKKLDRLESSTKTHTIGTDKLRNDFLADPNAMKEGKGDVKFGTTQPTEKGSDIKIDPKNIDFSQQTTKPTTDVETLAREVSHSEVIDIGVSKENPQNQAEEDRAQAFGESVEADKTTHGRAKKEEKDRIEEILGQ